MNYGKLTAGTTKTAIDTAKPSEKGEIITYLSRMGDVLHDVQERREVIVLRGGAVHIVVDSDEANALLREKNLRVIADLQVISAKTAEVFYNQDFHMTCFDFFQQGRLVVEEQLSPHVLVEACHPGHILKAASGKAGMGQCCRAFDISAGQHVGQLRSQRNHAVMLFGGRKANTAKPQLHAQSADLFHRGRISSGRRRQHH